MTGMQIATEFVASRFTSNTWRSVQVKQYKLEVRAIARRVGLSSTESDIAVNAVAHYYHRGQLPNQ